MTYKQIVDALFPMAARVSSQVDKEMITFSGATHVDNLEAFYKIFRGMILEPGWRADDLPAFAMTGQLHQGATPAGERRGTR